MCTRRIRRSCPGRRSSRWCAVSWSRPWRAAVFGWERSRTTRPCGCRWPSADWRRWRGTRRRCRASRINAADTVPCSSSYGSPQVLWSSPATVCHGTWCRSLFCSTRSRRRRSAASVCSAHVCRGLRATAPAQLETADWKIRPTLRDRTGCVRRLRSAPPDGDSADRRPERPAGLRWPGTCAIHLETHPRSSGAAPCD